MPADADAYQTIGTELFDLIQNSKKTAYDKLTQLIDNICNLDFVEFTPEKGKELDSLYQFLIKNKIKY